LVFEKAINIIEKKHHLTSDGKRAIINCYHEMKQSNTKAVARKNPNITID
jgi:hypothetical protein